MSIVAVIILLNIIAWNSTAFCDAYLTYIFPIWVNTYGRFTGLFPFSVGEIMLLIGVLLLLLTIVLSISLLLIWCKKSICKKGAVKEIISSPYIKRMIKGYYLFIAWVALIVSLIMTLNCFILYHASTFSETYFQTTAFGDNVQDEYVSVGQSYSLDELLEVRNYVVEKCNQLALLMERDSKGTVVYEEDVEVKSIECMQELGKTYGRLKGFYPSPKELASSDFFSQQYIQGYYFPFSMEANYNKIMGILNKPATICHELSHLRGYIFEDEANFISFLACVNSDDIFIQYSGYLSVLYYLDNDFYKAVGKDWDRYTQQPVISEVVHKDNVFVTEEDWERINKKALINTETVDEVSDVFMDMTLKANGVSDGKISYNRVVNLLLKYYDRVGFET